MPIEWSMRRDGTYTIWYEPEAKAERMCLLYQAADENILHKMLEAQNVGMAQ